MHIETNIVHGGVHHDEKTGAHVPPIYMTSTFVFKDADQGARLFKGEEEGYIYTRLGNPTIDLLAKKMALLESAEAGLAFASGMAAVFATVLTCCKTGEHMIVDKVIYGGTYGLCQSVLPRLGITTTFVDANDLNQIRAAIRPATKLILVESPANPTLKINDISAIAEIAHDNNILLCVDNTFATPYLQRPIELGADIVLHSATKYLGGHGDLIGGIVVGKKEFIKTMADEIAKDVGGCISPINAYLILRGLKTLAVRMERHSANAMALARFLKKHPKVEKVYYPGLEDHPGYGIARKQMRYFGGMLGFDLKGGKEAGKVVMNSVKVCTLAVSLGDTDTLIEHPASMTHSTYTEEELIKAGINPGFVRMSVGIENVEDLIDDIEQALSKI
ncbi:MAG: aminotransferase class I/II-fold pyridoxal phosphate-dependent enzyme [candidate division WOR-3 bacterium]